MLEGVAGRTKKAQIIARKLILTSAWKRYSVFTNQSKPIDNKYKI